ncbi:MAG TPA: peptidoglycan-binding domain-containing protein [Candidatus Limnocylindrales bacterium]|nr:peptidoglycan-binding domain-containing protein [Candidatus Limnocylindrales bacterium]
MRRKLVLAGVATALLIGTVAGLVLAFGSAAKEPAADSALPPATAKVIRTTLVETKTVPGTLGYGDTVPLSATGRGTLTWIAPVGSTVRRGKPLFRVDERPVLALYGSLPLYRPLTPGAKGRDVRQVERNLAALGYGGFTVDGTYTAGTAAAVRSWQADLGLPKTGTIEPGQVLFTPGPVRVAGHTARVGDVVGGEAREGGATVLTYTGTSRLVTVELEVADRPLAAKGRRVTITIPGLRPLKGTITEVGTTITAQGTASEEGAAPADTTATASAAVVEVTVTIADQKALGALDSAPVDVDFVSSKRADVLAVPVTALLALPKGGFGVEVVDGARTRIVPVRTGMFAAGQVEVRGKGIAVGTRVGVPK